MKIFKVSCIGILALTPALVMLPAAAQSQPLSQEAAAPAASKVDSMLCYLFQKRDREHLTRPITATLLLTSDDPQVADQIRHIGADIISRSSEEPLLTINIFTREQLNKIAKLPEVKHIESAYFQLGPDAPKAKP
ncbi:hypothetical protein [Celerinatantimonas sp. YJH-8]|uniref:hypothetical protein n=1 Tax=Celerinatantimonas sp. YJH-8 TaxID=3228714 RepID=UPI0038C7FB8F